MTVASVPARPRSNRSGLWTFLRLLGGWVTVAALAYLIGMPSAEFGWIKMLFAWVLLTLIADEFAGWFGYFGLALGVLPFLHATPEQWFIVFPLIFAALFALLLLKHSGGPFVIPFAALLFLATIVGAEKIGVKMKIPLALISGTQFRNATVMPMAAVMGFSFLRQLISLIWRWQTDRRLRVAARPQPVPQSKVPKVGTAAPSPVTVTTPAKAGSVGTPGTESETIVVGPQPPATQVIAPSSSAASPAQASQTPSKPTPTIIDFDLGEAPAEAPEARDKG